MSVAPPKPVGLVVDGERIGPAQLVGDEGGGDVLAVQTHAADVGVAAPVAPVQEPGNRSTHRLQATGPQIIILI